MVRVVRHHAGQSAAHVVLRHGLCSGRQLAPRRPAPYSVRRCRRCAHPAQAAQARRSGPQQRAPPPLRARIRLPEQGRIRNGLSVSAAGLQLLLSRTSWRKPRTVLPLRATTRAHQDSHCGKPHATGLAIREPQTSALRPDPICPLFPEKTAVAGFIRRHKLMEFEKSRLVKELVAEQPDSTLAELQVRLAKEKVEVSQSGISRFLHHINLTFKKKHTRGGARSARRCRGP